MFEGINQPQGLEGEFHDKKKCAFVRVTHANISPDEECDNSHSKQCVPVGNDSVDVNKTSDVLDEHMGNAVPTDVDSIDVSNNMSLCVSSASVARCLKGSHDQDTKIKKRIVSCEINGNVAHSAHNRVGV